MKMVLAGLAVVLPQRLKHLLYRRVFGWSVHPTARIGMNLITVDHLVVERDVRIAHFNVFRGCQLVHLGEGVLIGAFNWVSGPGRDTNHYPYSPDRRPRFVMGRHSSLTMRHVVDCSDEVQIGEFTSIGGMRSQILTHAPDLPRAVVVTAPVTVGNRALVFTGATLLAGCVVPSRSVVAAGAVVTGELDDELTLYGGVPARPLKTLPADYAWFTRTEGSMP